MTRDDPFQRKLSNQDKIELLGSSAVAGDVADHIELLSSEELCEKSGATYRQLNYWCSQGYIHPMGDDSPGSGRKRRFNPNIVNKVKLLVNISKAFERPNSPLGRVSEHYEEGELNMGNGIYLTWDVIEIEER